VISKAIDNALDGYRCLPKPISKCMMDSLQKQLRHGKSIDLDKTLESTNGGCKTGVVILDRGKSPPRIVATEVTYGSD